MPLEIIRDDIVRVQADAVVNAANSSLAPGGGVCGAIFAAAGFEKMERACRAIGHCEVGQSVLTDGFDLPARYVIHTVGPVWRGGGGQEEVLLRSCYRSALHLAEQAGCKSIAFPLISAGIYGYPEAEAMNVAVSETGAFLAEHEMQVTLVIFSRTAALLGEGLRGRLQSYIDDHYVDLHTYSRGEQDWQYRAQQLLEQESACLPLSPMAAAAVPFSGGKKGKRSLKDLLLHLDEPFSRMLLRLIDEKGMTDVEVYKRANMDRKLFSKIRREGYNPSKQTVIALAVALRLNLDETKDLLGRAGYALSSSSKSDVIVEYFIEEGVYDIYAINEALFAFDQRLLGA